LRSILFILSLGSLALAACTNDDSSHATASTSESAAEVASDSSRPKAHQTPETTRAAQTVKVTTPRVHVEGETAPRNRNERPLPAFEGITIAGTKLAIRDLLGARIVLFFFNPEVEPVQAISDAVSAIYAQSGAYNFNVIGIGVGSDSARLSRFARSHALKFRVIDDSAGSITRLLRIRSPHAIFGIDAEGYMSFGMSSFPNKGDVQRAVEADLRRYLRLPEDESGSDGSLYAYPAAPELGVISMSTGKRLETQDLEGRAAIVIFFLHTCPHCHHALASIKTTLESIPSEQRPRLIAISLQNAPGAIRQSMKELELDYFDPYLDPGQKAADRWNITGGVPVVIILDKEGRILHRSTGWDDHRDPGIVKMKASRAAGARIPMLLDPKGYSGNDVCGACHEQEYATWQYTAHSTAFDTLVAHTANRRTDCIGCHVVGFEEPGGYNFQRQPVHLENVGCESCHGRGGPHLTPSFVPKAEDGTSDYQQICATCHDPKHSLAFDYSTFNPRISHQTILGLSNSQRSELMGGSGPSRDLLPTRADHVGSNVCESCHEAEYSTWEAGPHGHAVKTLQDADKTANSNTSEDADCLVCHTTAYGKTGGFEPKLSVASQPDLARVGCESCHGPGGDHVGETAKRFGTILSLGDKCDSCVILKICGTCHDDANDPGFPFKVEQRIDAQRHGTIEAAATRDEKSADRARLHEAFARLAEHAVEPTTDLQSVELSVASKISDASIASPELSSHAQPGPS
jgi:peroxiredoxin